MSIFKHCAFRESSSLAQVLFLETFCHLAGADAAHVSFIDWAFDSGQRYSSRGI